MRATPAHSVPTLRRHDHGSGVTLETVWVSEIIY
jgi:hypothetical protein